MDLIFSKKVSFIGSFEPVFGFIKRCSGYTHEAPVIFVSTSTRTFGNVSSDTICRSNELIPDRILGKVIPVNNNIPNLIREFFRDLINFQSFKITFSHIDTEILVRSTTNHTPLTINSFKYDR